MCVHKLVPLSPTYRLTVPIPGDVISADEGTRPFLVL